MAFSLPILMLLLCSLTVAEGELKVYDLHAEFLPFNWFGTTDGFVKVYSNMDSVGNTSVQLNDMNPTWDEEFSYPNAKEGDILTLDVFDDDFIYDDFLGNCEEIILPGNYSNFCSLLRGGVLHYTYSFI
ncbi:perforin-1-like [Solea senegalensis]|uniref:Perforin-1-like n=1 Tax=Solea senegalensis TaxID=28829 RepID=A0AAV6QKZ3_SOLSE|nr:perforin-1-like [Solea senegalensis]